MIYSEPLTKQEVIEYLISGYDTTPEIFNQMVKFCLKYQDSRIVKEFNTKMNLKIRVFSPGKFQIKYYLT